MTGAASAATESSSAASMAASPVIADLAALVAFATSAPMVNTGGVWGPSRCANTSSRVIDLGPIVYAGVEAVAERELDTAIVRAYAVADCELLVTVSP